MNRTSYRRTVKSEAKFIVPRRFSLLDNREMRQCNKNHPQRSHSQQGLPCLTRVMRDPIELQTVAAPEWRERGSLKLQVQILTNTRARYFSFLEFLPASCSYPYASLKATAPPAGLYSKKNSFDRLAYSTTLLSS